MSSYRQVVDPHAADGSTIVAEVILNGRVGHLEWREGVSGPGDFGTCCYNLFLWVSFFLCILFLCWPACVGRRRVDADPLGLTLFHIKFVFCYIRSPVSCCLDPFVCSDLNRKHLKRTVVEVFGYFILVSQSIGFIFK